MKIRKALKRKMKAIHKFMKRGRLTRVINKTFPSEKEEKK